jgi:predicted deacetylase
MKARYLIRFDDICPTMNWPVWDQVERILIERNVRPLVAVVPDNLDENLMPCPPDGRFWERVRMWQRLGWAIGLHGYQHRYVTREAGLVGINPFSEFAGLPEAEQERKVRAGLEIFRRENVTADAWVAPGHSFDKATVNVLERCGLRAISDGLHLHPWQDRRGMLWIPQQLWRFRRMPLGVWTVAFHVNGWPPERVARLRTELDRYREALTSVAEIAECYAERERAWTDRVSAAALLALLRVRIGAQRQTTAA